MKLRLAGARSMHTRTILVRVCLAWILLAHAGAIPAQAVQAQAIQGQAEQQGAGSAAPRLSDETVADVRRVIQVFKQAAQDEDPQVRAAAVSSLAYFAHYDESVLDLLLAAAQSADAEVREAAISTLLELESPSDQTLDALLLLTGDAETSALLRKRVLDQLEAWGPGVILSRTIAALQSNNDTVRFSAVNLLSRFKHHARPGIDALLALSSEESVAPALRSSALNTVEIIIRDVTQEEIAAQQRELEFGQRTDEILSGMDRDGDGALSEEECGPNNRLIIPSDGRTSAIAMSDADLNADRSLSRDELLIAIARALGKRR